MSGNEETSNFEDAGIKSRLRQRKENPSILSKKPKRNLVSMKEVSYTEEDVEAKNVYESDSEYNRGDTDSAGSTDSESSVQRPKPKKAKISKVQEEHTQDESSSDEGSYSKMRSSNIAARMELMKKMGIIPPKVDVKPLSSEKTKAANGKVKASRPTNEKLPTLSVEELFARGILYTATKAALFSWLRDRGSLISSAAKKNALLVGVEQQLNKEKFERSQDKFPGMSVEERFAKSVLRSTPRFELMKWLRTRGVKTYLSGTTKEFLVKKTEAILNEEKEGVGPTSATELPQEAAKNTHC